MPGYLIDQYALSEWRGYLRIATTTGTSTPGPALPAEVVGGLAFSRDGKLLALALSGAAQPQDVWVLDRAAGKLWQVTHSPHAGVDLKTLVVPVDNFTIGQEEIHNTRLSVGELDLSIGDMLLGADFFLSHRIYVANSQHKLYFTYNGGPVFNLGAKPKGAQTVDAKDDEDERGDAGSANGPKTAGAAPGASGAGAVKWIEHEIIGP